MSSGETPVNIARLMATFNIEMRALPDDLKCAQCKSVLKDACQVQCGCRFCRTCIDHVVARGGQFCPGGSQECGIASLSIVQRDFKANRSIMKLTAKCPHAGCTHECPLADMEGHLRVCPTQTMEYPYSPFISLQNTLADGRVIDCRWKESGSHSETLIDRVANRVMDMLKLELVQKDQQMKNFDNQFKLIKEENQSIRGKIKSIKDENKAIKDEIKSVTDENKSIREENELMKNEIRSIKIENKSIKREKEVLSERVQQLEENLERKRDERRQSDERASAGISAVTGAVASNRDALGTEMELVRCEIRSIKEQLDAMKCQMIESMQVPVGLVQLDDWIIDVDVGKTAWDCSIPKTSGKFRGGRRHHTYELGAWNNVNRGLLGIWLRIWEGPSDAQLQWPFRGAVTITVAHRDNAKKCVRKKRQCQIERPPDNQCRGSDAFEFKHDALRGADLDLERGVRVSCQIVPGAGQ